jgi:hypothetical protein
LQSAAQLLMLSPVSHTPLPHTAAGLQSAAQLVMLSPVSHTPLPHTAAALQSAAQLLVLSPVSHTPLPHTAAALQSAAQLLVLSPVSHTPLPHTAAALQSAAQLAVVSPVSQIPLPHLAVTAGAVEQRLQTPTASPAPREQKSPDAQLLSLVHPALHVLMPDDWSQNCPAEHSLPPAVKHEGEGEGCGDEGELGTHGSPGVVMNETHMCTCVCS